MVNFTYCNFLKKGVFDMNRGKLATIALASMLGVSAVAGAVPGGQLFNQESTMIAKAGSLGNVDKIKKVTKPSSYKYTENQEYFLKYLNNIRKGMGSLPAELNPYLSQAAENHYQYLRLTGSNEHEQAEDSRGKKYFTGIDFFDRWEWVGLDSDTQLSLDEQSGGGGELIGLNGYTNNRNTSKIIYEELAVYHFAELIKPTHVYMGINEDFTKGSVIELLGTYKQLEDDEYNKLATKAAFYPYANQTNALPLYRDLEDGSPVIHMTGSSETGTPIIYYPELRPNKTKDEYVFIKSIKAHLYDDEGNEVSLVQDVTKAEYANPDYIVAVPYTPLKSGSTYSVKVTTSYKDGYKTTSSWKFKTKGEVTSNGELKLSAGKTAAVYNEKGKKVGTINSKKVYGIWAKKNGRYYLSKNRYVKITKDTVRRLGDFGTTETKVPYYNSKGKLKGKLTPRKLYYFYKEAKGNLYMSGEDYVKIKDLTSKGAVDTPVPYRWNYSDFLERYDQNPR